MDNKLIFVDTNILLDFYRTRTEAGLSLLKHLEKIQDKVIVTYQVEMEFKKHRQEAILESFKTLKSAEGVSVPGLFIGSATARTLKRSLKTTDKKIGKLRRRLREAFQKPTTHDPVYKTVQRLFLKNDAVSLTRDKPIRFTIRRRAWKRFILGYPPRKQSDTSIGDAINWEWIIDCAIAQKAEVVIVSRDKDYGASFEDEVFINDWLLQEFRARVSKKRKVKVYSHLSQALKLFEVDVSEAEIKEESEIASQPEIPEAVVNYYELLKKMQRMPIEIPPDLVKPIDPEQPPAV